MSIQEFHHRLQTSNDHDSTFTPWQRLTEVEDPKTLQPKAEARFFWTPWTA